MFYFFILCILLKYQKWKFSGQSREGGAQSLPFNSCAHLRLVISSLLTNTMFYDDKEVAKAKTTKPFSKTSLWIDQLCFEASHGVNRFLPQLYICMHHSQILLHKDLHWIAPIIILLSSIYSHVSHAPIKQNGIYFKK